MHLWQIRHIPNRPQTLLSLTLAAALSVAMVVTVGYPTGFVAGQTEDDAAPAGNSPASQLDPAEFFKQVRQELQTHQSVKADLSQSVSIGDQQFKITGQYLSSGNSAEGMKLMLNYSVVPDQGVTGQILEVCDGKELWTVLTLPDLKRVTLRNVLQIQKAAAAASKKSIPDSTLNAELGLGGLNALLASLERTVDFDVIKEEASEGGPRTIIQGKWKSEILQRFPKGKDNSLPAFVPDLVRLYVNSENLFPERLLYLKRQPESKKLRPLVNLEFRNVELDTPVDDDAFKFDIPDVVPEDVTKIYLDRINGVTETAPPAK
ncbi:outer membrane lipoprotein carrier protein LolA [Schlesneria sp. DSM 10557]|uniref:LolA family protein n=2 Tax=unclassified Schlesneria TaxID=2762017 RepID=UPI0035A1C533